LIILWILLSTIVKHFSIKKDENLHLVPGIENVNVFGVEVPNTNISKEYNFSCIYNVELKYIQNNEDPTYQIILNINPEDIYDLLERYPYIKKCEIPYYFNNDQLFLIYGKTFQSSYFDYEIFENKILIEKISNDNLKVRY